MGGIYIVYNVTILESDWCDWNGDFFTLIRLHLRITAICPSLALRYQLFREVYCCQVRLVFRHSSVIRRSW